MTKILLSRGESALKSNKSWKAYKIYKEIIKLEPQNAIAYQGASTALQNLGKHDAALDMSRKALEIDQNLVIPHTILANIYAKLGEREKSREEANIAFSANPELPEVLCCFGILSLLEGNLDEALKYLEKAVDKDRSYYFAHHHPAVIYQAKGDIKNLFRQTIILFRLKPSIRNALRLLYLITKLYRFIDFPILLVSVLLSPLLGAEVILFTTLFLILVYFVIGFFIGFADKERQWKEMTMNIIAGFARGLIGFGVYFFANAFLG